MTFPTLTTSLALLSALAASAQAPATLTVQVNKPGAAVNKNMYGLFFEDINFAADGGLYPELVKNKSFEINPGLIGWKALQAGFNLDTYAVRNEQGISTEQCALPAPGHPRGVAPARRASRTKASGAWA